MRIFKLELLCLLPLGALGGGNPPFIDPDALPDESVFPGPWEQYIKAPANKSFIEPARIWSVKGNVTSSAAAGVALREGGHVPGGGIMMGPGGRLTLEFAENVGGRYVLTSFGTTRSTRKGHWTAC